MGKIILEFDSYEEAADAKLALQASDWKHAMWKLDQELRSVTKYGASMLKQGEASEVEIEVAQKVRDSIRDILFNSNLDLE